MSFNCTTFICTKQYIYPCVWSFIHPFNSLSYHLINEKSSRNVRFCHTHIYIYSRCSSFSLVVIVTVAVQRLQQSCVLISLRRVVTWLVSWLHGWHFSFSLSFSRWPVRSFSFRVHVCFTIRKFYALFFILFGHKVLNDIFSYDVLFFCFSVRHKSKHFCSFVVVVAFFLLFVLYVLCFGSANFNESHIYSIIIIQLIK